MLIAGAYVPYIFRNTDKAAVNWKSSHETLYSRVEEIMLAKRLEQTRPDPEKRPRQRQVEGRRWTLIGEAYVYGIMHGEALLDESLKPGFIQSGLILLLTVANCSTSRRQYTSTPLFLPVVTLLVLEGSYTISNHLDTTLCPSSLHPCTRQSLQ
jgi:hypothetical protein